MDNNEQLESVLRQYCPVEPPDHLRQKILETGSRQNPEKPIFRWMALAAILMFGISLDLATYTVTRSNMKNTGIGKVAWTPQAEEMARLIDDRECGREYIELRLAAGDFSGDSQSPISNAHISGALQ